MVADPDPAKAALLQPTLRDLERLGVPHALFINKMDQARGEVSELLQALAPVSSVPLVARQIPMLDGEQVSGFIDLALERAFVYRPGEPMVEIPEALREQETEARFHMMELRRDTIRHFGGRYRHTLVRGHDGALKIQLQRVDLFNAQAPFDYVIQIWV